MNQVEPQLATEQLFEEAWARPLLLASRFGDRAGFLFGYVSFSYCLVPARCFGHRQCGSHGNDTLISCGSLVSSVAECLPAPFRLASKPS